eukprot:TRINITY_DN423_c3_g1_i2.p1 TRINITY_DN423_c3_g1~~TRINITY_DN423_c3_g1_i2.p1  ORF type:complete len:625 (-),score=110.68 TRINITY_DN423_c3_g1_i2:1217-3091(-)
MASGNGGGRSKGGGQGGGKGGGGAVEKGAGGSGNGDATWKAASRHAATTGGGGGTASTGLPASAYNPLSGTFHSLSSSGGAPVADVPATTQNGRYRSFDEGDESATALPQEFDATSNNGSCSEESEDQQHLAKDRNGGGGSGAGGGAGGSAGTGPVRVPDSAKAEDRRNKMRAKNEKKHQRQKERRAQDLRDRCKTLLTTRKLEAFAGQLAGMGFPKDRALIALICCDGHMERSVNWLLEGGEASAKDLSKAASGVASVNLDIGEELARLAELEIRHNYPRSEVERAVVLAEGDIDRASALLRERHPNGGLGTPSTETHSPGSSPAASSTGRSPGMSPGRAMMAAGAQAVAAVGSGGGPGGRGPGDLANGHAKQGPLVGNPILGGHPGAHQGVHPHQQAGVIGNGNSSGSLLGGLSGLSIRGPSQQQQQQQQLQRSINGNGNPALLSAIHYDLQNASQQQQQQQDTGSASLTMGRTRNSQLEDLETPSSLLISRGADLGSHDDLPLGGISLSTEDVVSLMESSPDEATNVGTNANAPAAEQRDHSPDGVMQTPDTPTHQATMGEERFNGQQQSNELNPSLDNRPQEWQANLVSKEHWEQLQEKYPFVEEWLQLIPVTEIYVVWR